MLDYKKTLDKISFQSIGIEVTRVSFRPKFTSGIQHIYSVFWVAILRGGYQHVDDVQFFLVTDEGSP